MDKILELLGQLIAKVPWLSEIEQEAARDLLRGAADELGSPDVVPPKPTDANVAPEPTPAPDPGPVAEPVPPAEQTPPPASPDLGVGDPENTNAFSGTEPDAPAAT